MLPEVELRRQEPENEGRRNTKTSRRIPFYDGNEKRY